MTGQLRHIQDRIRLVGEYQGEESAFGCVQVRAELPLVTRIPRLVYQRFPW